MSKTYQFLSKWTKTDELLAPYSASIFEKVAASYGRTWMAVSACVALVVIGLCIVGVGIVAVILLERAYLLTRGIESQATIIEIVSDPPTFRGSSEWATLKYDFQTKTGEKFSHTLRRAPWEFSSLAPGRRIDLLYIEGWPQLNLPRIGFKNSTFLLFMSLLGLAMGIHLMLFLVRYRKWRRQSMA